MAFFVAKGKSLVNKGKILDSGTEIQNKHGIDPERIKKLVEGGVLTKVEPEKSEAQQADLRADAAGQKGGTKGAAVKASDSDAAGSK